MWAIKFEICTGIGPDFDLALEMVRHGYGQFCPVAKAAEILTERWTPLVLRELLAGSHRFNELRSGVPLMSPSLLATRLRSLEQAGIVRRRRVEGAARYEYHLTEAGEAFRPVIDQMGSWGLQYGRDLLTRRDFDPALVMWSIFRQVRTVPASLPRDRTVVLFHFPDAPRKKRYWWVVIDAPDVDLCLSDPGFSVDLEVSADLHTIVMLVLHELSYADALRRKQVSVSGSARLRRALPHWLGLAAATRTARRA